MREHRLSVLLLSPTQVVSLTSASRGEHETKSYVSNARSNALVGSKILDSSNLFSASSKSSSSSSGADFALGGGFAFGVGFAFGANFAFRVDFAFDVDFAFGDAVSGLELVKLCFSILSTAAFAFF